MELSPGQSEVLYALSPQNLGNSPYSNVSNAHVSPHEMEEYTCEVVYTPSKALFSQPHGQIQSDPTYLEEGVSNVANGAVT